MEGRGEGWADYSDTQFFNNALFILHDWFARLWHAAAITLCTRKNDEGKDYFASIVSVQNIPNRRSGYAPLKAEDLHLTLHNYLR